MDERPDSSQQLMDILLVMDEKGTLQAVSGVKDGELQTKNPLEDNNDLLRVDRHGGKVGSILVTPSSTSKMNLRTIASSYGEFTPLVLEGTVLFQTKDKNPVYLFDHSQALAPLAQRFGTPDSRQFIQGAEMILYKDLQETAPQP